MQNTLTFYEKRDTRSIISLVLVGFYIRKLFFPSKIFNKCPCVCLFNHSICYGNMLVSFDNPYQTQKKYEIHIGALYISLLLAFLLTREVYENMISFVFG